MPIILKVEYFCFIKLLAFENNIFQFEVSMHNIPLMTRLQRPQDLFHNRSRFHLLEAVPDPESIKKVTPFAVLHHKMVLILITEGFIKFGNTGMVDGSEGVIFVGKGLDIVEGRGAVDRFHCEHLSFEKGTDLNHVGLPPAVNFYHF
jgi:hypothetical protein